MPGKFLKTVREQNIKREKHTKKGGNEKTQKAEENIRVLCQKTEPKQRGGASWGKRQETQGMRGEVSTEAEYIIYKKARHQKREGGRTGSLQGEEGYGTVKPSLFC